ncbi:MAG: hypothetical protein ACE148_06225 [Vicinamibacterales bacterium]
MLPSLRASLCASVVLALLLASSTGLRAAAGDQPAQEPAFRIFLTDGTALVSYGEYARVGDRLVFSAPVGGGEDTRLQLITLPVASVDMQRTESYSDSVRYHRYAATRGEADYARLAADVAGAIDQMAKTTDPARRLEIAEAARRAVADWPGSHFGYRSNDIRQIAALLDEAISELRATTGARQFALDLVAATVVPPDTPLLPPQTPAESIAAVLAAIHHVDVPAERISLLRVVASYIDEARAGLPRVARSFEKEARKMLSAELRVERDYASLARKAVTRAAERAVKGDVKGVLRTLADLAREDERLGRKRPDQVASTVAALEVHLDAARRVRLATDQWAARTAACAPFRPRFDAVLRELKRVGPQLEDIKSLSGPSPAALVSLRMRLDKVSRQLSAIVAPREMAHVHAQLASALNLGQQAVLAREAAVRSNDVDQAWNASSAAAGALMLIARARDDVDALFAPPGNR